MDDALRRARDDLCAAVRGLNRPVQIMEVCGTHTVSIFRAGIRSFLPEIVRLISGPGCPVCVTAQRHIDAAIEMAGRPDVILTTYGDMLRVPGRRGSLEQLRAEGADVRVVYSARGAIEIASAHPDRTVVFIAVGFETTAPATAAVLVEAERNQVANFCILPAHKLVIPVMMAMLATGDVPIDGFLCPGHVSVIIGAGAYRPIVDQFGKACVVAGFEPIQILRGLSRLTHLVAAGRPALENVYGVAVTDDGNRVAQALIDQVFERAAAPWRAMGEIPDSGLALRPAYRRFDALDRLGISLGNDEDHLGCRCGDVIQGKTTPDQCRLFGDACTPLRPIGPCMVSSEGTCAAWYKYGQRDGRSSGGAEARISTGGIE